MKKFIIVETTCASTQEAEKLAEILLQRKLAACIHLSPITSKYVWNEKIEQNLEILLRIKTAKELFSSVAEVIKTNNSYEVPQIISLEISQASESYLAWLSDAITKAGK